MKALLVSVLLVCLTPAANARVWLVDQQGGGDFRTIQEAIDAASNGDEVVVNAATYAENTDFLGKNIYVHSNSGPSNTTIDGAGLSCCVAFQRHEGSAAVLDGFTLTRGSGMTYLGQTDGGAIFCLMSSPTLRNCVFENNSATYAGAIYVDQGNPEVASCTFRGNTAATYGGAIAGPNSRPSIHDCLFENNYAGTGDGTIHVAFDSPIARCVFRNNEARSGAAINSGGASAAYRIQDCIFIGNRAHGQHGGAIRIHEANALVERCLFVDNSAALDGGAIIVIDGANPQIVNCTFDRNGAGRVGGTIAIWTDSAPAISNCIIANTTGNAGVYCVESYPLFSCDDAWRNAGGNYAGECSDPTGTSGNIAQDPLFCDPPGLDYGIAENSPCAPAHNPYCGLIGAYDVACNGPTPVASMTWGGVKAMFR